MELAHGGELYGQIARRGKLPEDEARIYFSQVLAAIDYCHSQSVCHRDLKLENVLLETAGRPDSGAGGVEASGTSAPRIKITDFGFSKDFLNDSLPKV